MQYSFKQITEVLFTVIQLPQKCAEKMVIGAPIFEWNELF